MKPASFWLQTGLVFCAILLTGVLAHRLLGDAHEQDDTQNSSTTVTRTSPKEEGFLNPEETPLTEQIIQLFKDDPKKFSSTPILGLIQFPDDPNIWFVSTVETTKEGFIFSGIYRIDIKKGLWNRIVNPASQKEVSPILLLGTMNDQLIAKRLPSPPLSAETCSAVLSAPTDWLQLSLVNPGKGFTSLASPPPDIEKRWQLWRAYCAPIEKNETDK